MKKNNQGGKPPVYDNSLKIAVSREYLTGPLGYGGLGKKYNLPAGTVEYFVKWYKRNYPDSAHVKEVSSLSSDQRGDSKKLQEANLKIASLEMLIEVVEKDLGIDIRKKAGTKQSS